MSSLHRIQFRALINAPVDVVWQTMLGDDSYRQWTAPFAEGSYFEGSWEQGSRIRFLSPSGDGMISEIVKNEPGKCVSIRHLGYIAKGIEDTSSEAVQAWAPAYENYTFNATPEGTLLVVDQDATLEFEQYLKETWPKALSVLKGLCEQKAAN